MKHLFLFFSLLLLFQACKSDKQTAWSAFTKCATNACVTEAVAVKDALLANPSTVLMEFQDTYAKGEDHVIGWLYIIRDSILTNPTQGTLDSRIAMRDKIVAAVAPYLDHKQFGEMARNVKDEMESIAMMAETEDAPEDPEYVAVTGTYQLGDGKTGSASGTIKAAWANAEQVRIELEVVSGGAAHNQGRVEGLAKRTAPTTYTWTTTEFNGTCSISFNFQGESVIVKTESGDPASCGFGNGVVPDGNYQRNSYYHPFLSKTELRMSQKLEGEWISGDDPKSSVKFKQGVSEHWYDGKVVEAFPYQFHAQCPEECGMKMAKFPCYSVYGQDVVCHAIVKVDNVVLEVSQVGGTGNTLKYKRAPSMQK